MKRGKREGVGTWTAMRRIMAYLGKGAPITWFCVLIWASQDFLGNYLVALFNRNLVAAVTEGVGMRPTFQAVGLYVGMQLLYIGTLSLGILGFVYWNRRMRNALESDLLNRLLRAARPRPSAERVSLFIHDTEQAQMLVTQHFGTIWMAVIALVGSAAVVASVDLKLCGLALAGGLFFMLTDIGFVRPNRRIGAQIQEGKARANARLGDAISGALTIRLLGLAERMLGEHNQALAEIRRLETLRVRYRCAQAVNDTWRGWIISVGILGVGCLEVARGAYSLADLMLVTSMLGQLLYKFTLIVCSVIDMQQSAAAAERVVRALDEPLEDLRPAGQRVTPAGDIALALEVVTFAYGEDRGAPALETVSLSLRRGETVALVGASGSGKTTVFRLLLGMAAPQSGTVRLWDVPCAEASLETWRAQLAYVAQESPLFDGSLAENIGWGMPDCDGARIEAAAEAAYAADFIRQRPEGLNARVGTGGSLFSGGERQRIAIARAFARNAPILLLDEATSALDADSEEAVQAALNRLMAGRTVLVAAHRLSTIRNADRILVFEGGRIVEEGTHEALLRQGGVYRRLWEVQGRRQA